LSRLHRKIKVRGDPWSSSTLVWFQNFTGILRLQCGFGGRERLRLAGSMHLRASMAGARIATITFATPQYNKKKASEACQLLFASKIGVAKGAAF
jgi:hypothetical protein